MDPAHPTRIAQHPGIVYRRAMRAGRIAIAFVLLSISPVPVVEGAAPEVRQYGAAWCGPCRAVRSFLEKNGVPFRYVDIDVPAGREEFHRVSGGNSGIPLIFIGQERINGADLRRIRLVLEREKLIKEAPAEGKEGVDLFGGHSKEWWRSEFRDLRTYQARLEEQVRALEPVAVDNVEKEVLSQKKDNLRIVRATIDQLDNDASKVALPREYRE
jgi:glutaredoxin